MKKWLIWIGIIAIIFIGGYMVLSFYAVKFLHGKLRDAVIPGVTIAEISIKATHLSARGVVYEEPFLKKKVLRIREMKIYPHLFSSFKKTLRIRKWVILQPSISISRSGKGDLAGPWIPIEKSKKGMIPIPEEGDVGTRRDSPRSDTRFREGDSFQLEIDRLQILKGTLDFEDEKTGGIPAHLELKEMNVIMRDLRYPFIAGPSLVEFKGKVKGQEKEGTVQMKGWINFETFDMEAILKVQGIDVKAFEPYYQKRVSAEIESGSIEVEAKIVLQNKMMDAPGYLELTGLHVKGSGSVFWIPAETLVTLLEKKGDRIKVKFHIRGNMDDPRFNLKEALFTRIGFSFAEALGATIK